MPDLKRLLRPALALVLLAVVAPACRKGTTGPVTPPVPPPTILFAEGWDALVYPGGLGSQWTVPLISGTPLAVFDTLPADGNPAPSLSVTPGPRPATYSTTAVPFAPFTAPSITFSATIMVTAADDGKATFEIDAAGATATAVWDAALGQVTVSITIGGTTSSFFLLPSPVGTFHTVLFSVDSLGRAVWAVDGVLAPFVSSPWPAGLQTLKLMASFTSAGFLIPPPEFKFDDILVTTP